MTTSKEELKHRVLAKKHELQQKLEQFQADAQGKADQKVGQIESKLKEMDDILRSGWEQLTEAGANRLNEWLK